MAQETAASFPIPEGGLVRAWLDAFLHPKFETFQRWFPRMQPRWRRISLIVSLLLILVTTPVHIALASYSARQSMDALVWRNLVTYLLSPPGRSQAAYYCVSSVLALYAIPAVVTLISPRSLGPYPIRFKRVFRPWIQVQPAICLYLLFSAGTQLILTIAGIYQSSSTIDTIISLVLVVGSA